MTTTGAGLIRRAALVAGLGAMIVLAGCTVPVRGAGDSAGPAAPSAGSSVLAAVPGDAGPTGTVVVTVPGLAGTPPAPPSSGEVATGGAVAGSPGVGPSAGLGSTSAGATPATTTPAVPGSSTPSARSGLPSSSPRGNEPAPRPAPSPYPATTSASAASTTAVIPPVLSTTDRPSPSSARASSAPAPTVAVSVAGCPACQVLATRAGVRAGFSAALIAPAQGRAALVSLRSNGSVGGVVNIPYGSSFPSPDGAALPCDVAARCLVTALRPDGHAVLSAWQLGDSGGWTDVSIPGGFVSLTGRAGPVDLDGGLGVAVQVAATGTGGTGWLVYAWSGQGYAVLGCATGGAEPDVGSLSPDSCPS